MIGFQPHYGRISPSAPDTIKNDMFTPGTKEEDKRVLIVGIGFLYNELKAICVLPTGELKLIRYIEHVVFDSLYEGDKQLGAPNMVSEDVDRLISSFNMQQEELNELKERLTKLESYLAKVSNGNNKGKSSGATSGKASSGEEQTTDVTQLTESEGTNA